jgi:muramidase (phage lysozyme)
MTNTIDRKKKLPLLPIVAIGIGLIGITAIVSILSSDRRSILEPRFKTSQTPPLVMKGGDPHIRALMRMISASESNSDRPYSILYGGTHVKDLSRHPERCIRIVNGPNVNNCSTAAGRYQMINTTWAAMATKYHPSKQCRLMFLFDCSFSFAPEYQDAVVYKWLADESAWGMNIAANLKAGNLDLVRKRLSSTWTSLGYGIETNSITPKLPKIYQRLLTAEQSGS